MAHGGYDKRRVKPAGGRRSKALAVEKKPKLKNVSTKNQIRSIERMLRKAKDLPPELREAQEKKLEELKKQQETTTRLALEKKIFLRDKKIKFFERRKIERRLRRLEKMQRSSSAPEQNAEISEQLSKLKEDLEYVRFFPKKEKYVSLFTGGDDSDVVDRRNGLRKQIKANLDAAAASGKDLEETGSEDDGLLDLSEDDFFLSGSSSDEADADDEWTTDKSTREQASSASGKAASGMSSDERNQNHQVSASRSLMPPPRPSNKSFSSNKSRFDLSSRNNKKSRFDPSSGSNKKSQFEPSSSSNKTRFGPSTSSSTQSRGGGDMSTSSNNTSNSHRDRGGPYVAIPRDRVIRSHSGTGGGGHSSNLSSNSDAHKPRRKRRPKKKKQQG